MFRFLNFNILLFFIILSFPVQAQVYTSGIGEWEVMGNNRACISIDVLNQKIFSASKNIGFYFNKEDNQKTIFSKATGLNGTGITCIRAVPNLNQMIIGYENGMIDLWQDDQITTINDIFRADITGSKKINSITIKNTYAYISCAFGLVVFDIAKKEIRETWQKLHPLGTSTSVYECSFSQDKDSVFLATDRGVLCARFNTGTNLMDYSNWFQYTLAVNNIDTLKIASVASINGIIYAAMHENGIYWLNGNQWVACSIPISTAEKIYNFRSTNNKLYLFLEKKMYRIDSPSSYTQITDTWITQPRDAYFDNDQTLWIADSYFGLIKIEKNASEGSLFSPDGPSDDNISRCYTYDGNLIMCGGGYDGAYIPTYDNNWFNVNTASNEWFNGIKYNDGSVSNDLFDIHWATFNPKTNKIFLSSFVSGLIIIDQNKKITLLDHTNSDFPTFNNWTQIGESRVDQLGQVWVVARSAGTGDYTLFKINTNGSIDKYLQQNSSELQNLLHLSIDNNDNKWMSVNSSGVSLNGIIIYNEKKNSYRKLINVKAQGNLPDPTVHCMTIDQNGYMWIGTNKGLAICYNTSTIGNSGVDLTIPYFEGFPLLYERVVYDICVDGANRKWISTDQGVWLFNPDCTQIIDYFNSENSPLLSNKIMDVEVDAIGGYVYFSTDKGVVRYRGTATEGKENFDQIKIFPNPVRPGFEGNIGISGLTKNAQVKITDLSGMLTYEAVANGGTVAWNGKDYKGKKCAAGVYIVFATSEDGKYYEVGKIVFLE